MFWRVIFCLPILQLMWPYPAPTLKNHRYCSKWDKPFTGNHFSKGWIKRGKGWRGDKFSWRGEPALRAPCKTISSDQIKQLFMHYSCLEMVIWQYWWGAISFCSNNLIHDCADSLLLHCRIWVSRPANH